MRAHIDELRATHGSLTAGTEGVNVEFDILAAHIYELGVYAATCDGELGVLVAVQSLKVHVAAARIGQTK